MAGYYTTIRVLEKTLGTLLSIARRTENLDNFNNHNLARLGITLRNIEEVVLLLRKIVDDTLRERALQKTKGEPGSVSFFGGKLLVVVQPPRPKVQKSPQWTENAQKLGVDLGTYFRKLTVYEPVRGFKEHFKTASSETKQLLLEMVELKVDPPRVSYKDIIQIRAPLTKIGVSRNRNGE